MPMKDSKIGIGFLPFKEARVLARSLNLRSVSEWKSWAKSGKRPRDIPYNPTMTYKGKGWIDWPDWLGYKKRVDFLPFEEARAFVRSLEFKSQKEWQAWSKSGKRPRNIPSAPNKIYKEKRWVDWPDWLGYKSVGFLPFEVVREVARGLEFKSQKEWQAWSKSGKRPPYIPSNPNKIYKGKGWVSWDDWLGYAGWLSFDEAREIVRSSNLRSTHVWENWEKSANEWRSWSTHARPRNIPSHPFQIYSREWISWADWLGYETEG